MEPPPVEFVAAGSRGGGDEELPEPPHRPDRWQLIGIAVTLVVLAGIAVRVLASAPDHPPVPPVTPSASGIVDSATTGGVRNGAPPDVFPVDPSDVHLFPVGCNQRGRGCVLEFAVPLPFFNALRSRFSGVRTERAATIRVAEPVGGRLIGYDYFGRAGLRTISVTVRPSAHKSPNYSGSRRAGRAIDVYAETSRGGYRIQIDVLAPPGRTPKGDAVWQLSLDPRLRP